jgi:hypothetical protein
MIMLTYTTQVPSEALAALATLPPIEWSIVAYELLTTVGLVLSAIGLARMAWDSARRRWLSRGRA